MTTTVSDRWEQGRAVRGDVPRSSHAEWEPAPDRRDPLEILEEESATRLPELVPIRYGRMLVTPFTFYRGAAGVMAADLAAQPNTGLEAQLCGDAHLSNFGLFSAPDRRLVFDCNDFDETHPGPFEWDVKRLATSIEIAGRDLSLSPRQRRDAVLATLQRYRETMRSFARMGHLDVWYSRLDEESAQHVFPRGAAEDVAKTRKTTEKARAKTSLRAVLRLTEKVDGELRIRSDPPLVVRAADLLEPDEAEHLGEWMRETLAIYAESLPDDRRRLFEGFEVVDMARKVVGVGSVGTRAWVILLRGLDDGDPLVLQAKEAEASVLEEHLAPSPYANHGERVVQGQRLMQASSDILLGWLRAAGTDGQERDFYVRQLWDGKGSFDVATMSSRLLSRYGEVCAWTLARAHARTGDRCAIAGYLGNGRSFDRAVAEFALRYADRNETDFERLIQAVDAGRLPVMAG